MPARVSQNNEIRLIAGNTFLQGSPLLHVSALFISRTSQRGNISLSFYQIRRPLASECFPKCASQCGYILIFEDTRELRAKNQIFAVYRPCNKCNTCWSCRPCVADFLSFELQIWMRTECAAPHFPPYPRVPSPPPFFTLNSPHTHSRTHISHTHLVILFVALGSQMVAFAVW